ncbi:MAG: S8 family serine peptidase [Bacilli bacterium]|nr:S8 family serine peptidase [Bacilli bacterium]
MRKILILFMLIFCLSVSLTSKPRLYLSEKIIFEGFNKVIPMSIGAAEQEIILETSESLKVDVVYASNFSYDVGDYNNITSDNVGDIKTKRIEAGRKYHSALNKKNLATLPNFDYKNIYLSSYLPVISLEVYSKDIIDDNFEILNNISKNSDVLNVIVKASMEKVYSVETLGAFENINVIDELTEGTLRGNGVKVGVLDTGIVDVDAESFVNTSIVVRNHPLFIETEREHSTLMAALIAGRQGVAPNATIYSVQAFNNLSGELDWLIEQEVDVVNMSISSEKEGTYNSNAALVDYMVWAYGITACTAAGNCEFDDPEKLVGDLGMAYNAISVGWSTSNNGPCNSFCYNTLNGVDKPTIGAYGSNTIILDEATTISGTSVSTALTTGVVALLMELDLTLKLYPAKVTALLAASSRFLDYNGSHSLDSGMDQYLGAGLVDFVRAKECINNIIHYQFSGNASPTDILSTNNISWSSGQFLRMAISWLAKSTGSVNSIQNNNFDLAVHKVTAGEVATSWGSTGTLDMINYETEYGGTHKVRIVINNTVTNYGPTDIFICWHLDDIEE